MAFNHGISFHSSREFKQAFDYYNLTEEVGAKAARGSAYMEISISKFTEGSCCGNPVLLSLIFIKL